MGYSSDRRYAATWHSWDRASQYQAYRQEAYQGGKRHRSSIVPQPDINGVPINENLPPHATIAFEHTFLSAEEREESPTYNSRA